MADFELSLAADTSKLEQGERALDGIADEAERTERRTKGATDGMGRSYSRASATASAASRRIAASLGALAGAALAAFGSARVVNTIANFETSMARVGAISRASAEDLGVMRDAARELGATTEFSATQAADGLSFLAMAGFTATESVEAIPAVLDLATASMMDLGSTADIASNVLSGFGMEARQAADVADVLAAASTRSNTSVAQLGGAMSTAAPIAASLGIGLEETAAAIGTMSDAGIQGERAGTALRGVLASLAAPTDQAADALSKYGLSVADVDVESRGFANVLETLRQAGIETGDAMQIFGREAASGALVMIDGAQRVGEFTEELRGAEGAAADMAEGIRDNLGGDLKTLGSVIQDLMLTIGESGFTTVLRNAVQGVTQAVSFLSENFESLQGIVLATATAATVYFAPAMAASAIATGRLVASLVTLRSALISTGIGAAVVAAGLLIGEFIKLVKQTGSVGAAFQLLGQIAREVFTGTVEDAGNIPPGLEVVWGKVRAGFYGLLADMGVAFGNWVQGIIDGASKLNLISFGDFKVEIENPFLGPLRGIRDSIGETTARFGEMAATAGNAAADAAGAVKKSAVEIDETEIVNPFENLTTVDPSDAAGAGGGGGGGAAKSLTDALVGDLDALRDELRTETEVVQEWYDENLALLIDAKERQMITEEEYRQLRERLESEHQDRMRQIDELGAQSQIETALGAGESVLSALGAFNEKAFKMAKVFGAAEALISTYRGAAKELEKGTFGFATAAAVIAKGLGFVAAIKSVSASGGGGSGGGGGGAGAARSEQPAQQQRPARVLIESLQPDALFTGAQVQRIVDTIQEEFDNRGLQLVFA